MSVCKLSCYICLIFLFPLPPDSILKKKLQNKCDNMYFSCFQKQKTNVYWFYDSESFPSFTYSKSATETLEKGVKYVQS